MFIESHYGSYIVHNHRTDWQGCKSPNCGRSELVQTDWDYPATAQLLGWSLRRVQQLGRKRGNNRCNHQFTDGTVDCPECGMTATEFIVAAGKYLHEKADS